MAPVVGERERDAAVGSSDEIGPWNGTGTGIGELAPKTGSGFVRTFLPA